MNQRGFGLWFLAVLLLVVIIVQGSTGSAGTTCILTAVVGFWVWSARERLGGSSNE